MQDVDIYKVKKEDLDFSSNLSLEVSRDDYCHALVAYFTAEFSKSHTKLGFCTGTLDWRELCSAARVLTCCFCCCCAGPRSQYTHWNKTVFYLQDLIVCKKVMFAARLPTLPVR